MSQLPTTRRILSFQSPAYLCLDKRRIRIKRRDLDDAFVPIEDIEVMLLESLDVTITTALVAALAEAEVCVLICNEKHLPVAAYIPFAAHHQHTRILAGQIGASEPTKKRVWQQIIRAKLTNQAAFLATRPPSKSSSRAAEYVSRLVSQVRSGDTTNAEAVAAAAYFPAAFGDFFTRDSEGQDLVNSMLNYGYALVRGAVCRAICAAGLHPALGVFHHNRFDPYALADDAMEPLRPLVDRFVLEVDHIEDQTLTPSIKRQLHSILTANVELNSERLPLLPALERYAANLRRCILSEANRLICPADVLASGPKNRRQKT